MCNDPIPNCTATKQLSQSNMFEHSIHSDPAVDQSYKYKIKSYINIYTSQSFQSYPIRHFYLAFNSNN